MPMVWVGDGGADMRGQGTRGAKERGMCAQGQSL